MARKNRMASIRRLAVVDTPCHTTSEHHRSFLPESLPILRIALGATEPRPIAELASRPRRRELPVGGTEIAGWFLLVESCNHVGVSYS